MEQKPIQNATKIATKWAGIYTLIAIIITYIIELAAIDPNSAVKYVTFIPFVIFLYLAQKEYRETLGGYISFGNAFSAGFRYSIFSGLFLAVFTYLYFTVLNPSSWQVVVDATRTAMEAKDTPEAQIDKTLEIMDKYGKLLTAFGSAFSYGIFGAIISLIGAAIVKKERSPYDIAMDAEDPTNTDPTV